MSIKHLMCFAILLSFILTSALVGQLPPADNSNPLPIDAKMRGEVIESLLKELEENYVFPEVAEKMTEAINKCVELKKFDDAKTGQEFAQQLTAELQRISKDKHLRVRCSTAKLPPETKSKEPTPDKMARAKQETKMLNAGFRKIERLPGNVGYLALDAFMHTEVAAAPAAAAMNFLANTDAMILDLRQNGGGRPHTVALVCSYFFGEKPIHLNSLYWRRGDRTDEFWTLKKLEGPRFLDKPLYVLTSRYTFSGAEECAYNLQTQKRATIVGETTGGGAHPGGTFRINDHFMVFVPTGRAINPITKTNWEGTGVKPDIEVAADKALDTAHQKAIDHILAQALDEDARRLIRDDIERAKRRDRTEKSN